MTSQPDEGEVMGNFKTLLHSLLGTDEKLTEIEQELKSQLAEARGKTREALESLKRMAENMQWRIEKLEEVDKKKKKVPNDAK